MELVTETKNETVSLRYLFFTFLKIGTVSFGGHMALISVLQKEMVEKDQVVTAETLLDAVGVASLLPGPMAVNVVTFIGYHLKGVSGAIASMLGVLLPACTLMLLLAWAYFNYAFNSSGTDFLYFIPGTVAAIVLSAGLQLYTKEIGSNPIKIALCFLTLGLLLFFQNYFLTIALLLVGGLAGHFLQPASGGRTARSPRRPFRLSLGWKTSGALITLGIIEVLFLTNAGRFFENLYVKTVLVFSGISLSLFGGGYVMIPIMQSLFVEELQWLLKPEFVDAIAFSQLTPGPILVSATFIGYKLAGIWGALLATISIFTPSAVLMIVVSGFFDKNRDQQWMRNVLAGIKAVVVGMILVAALKIGWAFSADPLLVGVSVVVFVLGYSFKVSPVYLILLSVLAGINFYSWGG